MRLEPGGMKIVIEASRAVQLAGIVKILETLRSERAWS
jgi:hypothetical protein